MPTVTILASLLEQPKARSWLLSRHLELAPVGDLQLEFSHEDSPELTEFLIQWASWVTAGRASSGRDPF